MLRRLTGKVSIITGSTSGIGLAIARNLAQSGSNIVLNGMGDLNEIKNLQNEISQKYNVKTIYLPKDLIKAEECKQLVDETFKQLGSVDIVVNNAGMQYVAKIEDFPDAKFEQIIDLNYKSNWYICKQAIPYMKKNNWGRIINIASVHGLVASIEKTPYVSSKHAVVGLTKTLALELAQTGITANVVCPGWVNTPLIRAQIQRIADEKKQTFEEAQRELLKPKTPSMNFVELDHLGQAVEFLCSEAGNEIRGLSLNIDGGWCAQ